MVIHILLGTLSTNNNLIIMYDNKLAGATCAFMNGDTHMHDPDRTT